MQEEYTTYSTLAVDGKQVPVYTRPGIVPARWAQQTTIAGRGQGDGPTIARGGDGAGYGYSGNASGGSGIVNGDQAAEAGADPFNPQKSPVVWAMIFLVVGLLGLRYVHWRG